MASPLSRGAMQEQHTTTILFFLSLLLFTPIFSDSAREDDKDPEFLDFRNLWVDPSYHFENSQLRNAYIALTAWKMSIYSDPKGLTGNWVGPDVCNYTGIFCSPLPGDPTLKVVAGVDLNHGDIDGYLSPELGLLADLALFHVNSNQFRGSVPRSFENLSLLYELDISNNRFSGRFPEVLLDLPSLKYLDIRFNEFVGSVPGRLFDKPFDAVFINNNRFSFAIPSNFGNSPVSVIVIANNNLRGCIPQGLANMSKTLTEIVLINSGLTGCLPPEIGRLEDLRLLDLSFNWLVGSLPESLAGLKRLEVLNVGHNILSGRVPHSICSLPKLKSFIFSFNFFTGEGPNCRRLPAVRDKRNCLPRRPWQRPVWQCRAFFSLPPVDCRALAARCPNYRPLPTLPSTKETLPSFLNSESRPPPLPESQPSSASSSSSSSPSPASALPPLSPSPPSVQPPKVLPPSTSPPSVEQSSPQPPPPSPSPLPPSTPPGVAGDQYDENEYQD